MDLVHPLLPDRHHPHRPWNHGSKCDQFPWHWLQRPRKARLEPCRRTVSSEPTCNPFNLQSLVCACPDRYNILPLCNRSTGNLPSPAVVHLGRNLSRRPAPHFLACGLGDVEIQLLWFMQRVRLCIWWVVVWRPLLHVPFSIQARYLSCAQGTRSVGRTPNHV